MSFSLAHAKPTAADSLPPCPLPPRAPCKVADKKKSILMAFWLSGLGHGFSFGFGFGCSQRASRLRFMALTNSEIALLQREKGGERGLCQAACNRYAHKY